jgi:hypothetical protein
MSHVGSLTGVHGFGLNHVTVTVFLQASTVLLYCAAWLQKIGACNDMCSYLRMALG